MIPSDTDTSDRNKVTSLHILEEKAKTGKKEQYKTDLSITVFSYDPRVRPWYTPTKKIRNITVVSSPFAADSTSDKIVTMSRAILTKNKTNILGVAVRPTRSFV